MKTITLLLLFQTGFDPRAATIVRNHLELRLSRPQYHIQINKLTNHRALFHEETSAHIWLRAVNNLSIGHSATRLVYFHTEFMHAFIDGKLLEVHGFSEVGRGAVVSVSGLWLDQSPDHYNRLVKITLHELYHTFGVANGDHCRDPRCLMNVGDLTVTHLDTLDTRLCGDCETQFNYYIQRLLEGKYT